MERPDGWEVHHVVPPAYGGSDALENCEVLCQTCRTRADALFGTLYEA